MPLQNCPVCEEKAIFEYSSERGGGVKHFKCGVCGNYLIVKHAEQSLQISNGFSKKKKDELCYKISGILKNGFIKGKEIELDFKSLKELEEFVASADVPKSRQEMADRLLLYLKNKQGSADINIDTDYPIAYTRNNRDFNNLLEEIIDQDLIKKTRSQYKLTLDGWSYIEARENKKSSSSRKIGF